MPAGLDGNREPLRTPARDAVLAEVAAAVLALRRGRPVLVGVDGQAGSGKSTFADELAERLAAAGVAVVRSTTDSFHRPRRDRFPPGVDLADSYVDRSHDLDAVRRHVIDPFLRGGGAVRVAAFDERSDAPIDAPPQPVPPDGALVFDGLFLHRPELRSSWTLSVLLVGPSRARADAAAGLDRCQACGPDALLHVARWAALAHRYLHGWERYVERDRPEDRATFVVDNDDLAAPVVVRRR